MKSITQAIITGCLLLTTLHLVTAQVGINTEGSDPDASAMLDVSSTDKGVLIPRLTTTQRETISNPAVGLLVFDSTTESFWFKTNAAWVELITIDTNTQLSEAEVDDFVSNNGYLTSADDADADPTNEIELPAGGTDGQVLKTDGNGTVSWIDIALTNLSDADNDTKIQVEKSSDEDIIHFDLGGTEFIRLDSGRMEIVNTGGSIFIGDGAGANDDYDGNYGVFLGDSTGYANTSGIGNIFLGKKTGYANTSGGANVFLGYESGISNTTGGGNIFTGGYSGNSNTTGDNNIFSGFASGYYNTTGNDNVFSGYYAGYNNATGNDNIFLGYYTGLANTTGYDNVYVGSRAGLFSTGSKNVFIGNRAGYNETGDDKLYIDNSSTTSPLIYGDFAADSLQINGKLNIGGVYNFPTTDGTASQFLTTDGSGTLSWADVSLTNLSDTDSDTKIQVEESSDEDIIRFDLGGTEFMRLDNGRIEVVNTGSSVFIGDGAGSNDDFSSNKNVFIGKNAGNDNTSGNTNTFIGNEAGAKNTTGEQNVFIGSQAGNENSTGNYNIGLGHYAGFLNETGDHNIYIGTYAGSVSDGTNNIFIGYYAGAAESGSNKLYIDNSGASSPLIYGEFDNDLLQINGILNISGNYAFPSTDGSTNQTLITDGSGTLSWAEIADNQTIDVFSLSSNNLQLSLEDDGQSTQTVDLSGYLDNTDNQTIDVLSFSNNTLSISIEDDGESNQTVDLTMSAIEDGGGDTKVDVGSSNQISFDLGGTEYFNMDGPHLEVLNSGSSVFIGEQAGENDDLTTNINVAIGNQALQTNSGGAGNIAIGTQALQATTSGFNTVIGNYAGYQSTSSQGNVFIGYSSGQYITTGDDNVFIGENSGGTSNVSNKLFIDNSNTNAPLIYGEFDNDLLEFNGKVGIGTTPTNGKLEVNGSVDRDLINYTYVNNSNSDVVYIGYTVADREVSIYASDRIVGKYVISLSDERIKDIKGISDSEKDLEILNQIQITDYEFIDKVREGNIQQKKVIAQQVAEVFPQAVEKQITEIVPDIYQTAKMDENGWISFNGEWKMENGELAVGEKVQIIFEDKKELLEVLEIKENSFRVEPSAVHRQPSTVFVYGRQVHDFHTVDYQAISMLNVSATQQLAKEVERLKIQNEQLIMKTKVQQEEINQFKTQLQKVNQLEQQNTEMRTMLEQIQGQLNHPSNSNRSYNK